MWYGNLLVSSGNTNKSFVLSAKKINKKLYLTNKYVNNHLDLKIQLAETRDQFHGTQVKGSNSTLRQERCAL